MAYNKLSNYRTAWHEDNEGGVVIYAKTKIVEWKNGKIKLNSDGWETVTTKRKMNQASHQFCLGFSVYQKNYEWFVVTPTGETLEYHDGMEF